MLGGRYSEECTLILTEGDSAKTLALSGISVVGRDKYGVFPLKGKLLNVREASHQGKENHSGVCVSSLIYTCSHDEKHGDSKLDENHWVEDWGEVRKRKELALWTCDDYDGSGKGTRK